jgi:hypothetical protein
MRLMDRRPIRTGGMPTTTTELDRHAVPCLAVSLPRRGTRDPQRSAVSGSDAHRLARAKRFGKWNGSVEAVRAVEQGVFGMLFDRPRSSAHLVQMLVPSWIAPMSPQSFALQSANK